jgi:hypothetical protein
VLDELDQPFMVDGVEKATNVCVQHPAHAAPLDPDTQRIQRLMLATLWSKSVGETEKVHFVDGC